MLYLIVKWLHVLLAIVAVGANITYGFWLARARHEPGALSFALRGVKLLDDRIANPAYVMLLLTGLTMVWLGPLPWTTPWLLLSLVLYAVLGIVGLLGYTPTLRRQIELLERDGPASADYVALARRARFISMALALLVLTITYLMVVKPPLW